MAREIRATAVALFAALLLIALLPVHLWLCCAPQSSVEPEWCEPVPPGIVIGPERRIDAIEKDSPNEILRSASGAPLIPIGNQYREWGNLRALARPGDTAHEYTGEFHGGYMLIRRNCYVGHVVTWID